MRKILFIHPDHKLVGIYQNHLKHYIPVDSAQDGMSGLRMIRQHKPGIIISDYDLPYMSGLALLKYVRKHKEMYANPFIFLTTAPMREEALGLGATAWVNQNEHGPQELMQIFQRLRI